MEVIHTTPTLRAPASNDKHKFWFGEVLTDGTSYYYRSQAWTESATKKDTVKVSEPSRVEGKNLGRSNETSPRDQAVLEIDAKWRKKQDEGYRPIDGEVEVTAGDYLILPMLAHPLEDKAHRLSFPAYVQPKYDGMRVLYQNGRGFWSRKGKAISTDITAHLETQIRRADIDTDWILDGELILPEEFGLQNTMKAAKKFRPDLTPSLLFRVYDVYDCATSKMPFHERLEYLDQIVNRFYSFGATNVRLTPTYEVNTMDEIYAYHQDFVRQGWEGTMIRMAEAPYKAGHRSEYLLKLKDFRDAEFTITGVREGRGKFEGCAIFQCATPEGKTFDVTAPGDLEEKRELFDNAASLIGQPLTVRFQRYTTDGIPFLPVAVAVRNYEG